MHHPILTSLILPMVIALNAAVITQANAADPVVLTFSTVGDSRQDPVKPDPTTVPVSEQDQQWLQNTKVFSRILRGIQAQKASLLFFNGDMIMGYGRAAIPGGWSTQTPTAEQQARNIPMLI